MTGASLLFIQPGAGQHLARADVDPGVRGQFVQPVAESFLEQAHDGSPSLSGACCARSPASAREHADLTAPTVMPTVWELWTKMEISWIHIGFLCC